jgi:uncharacterized protein YbaR (Trm112 family)
MKTELIKILACPVCKGPFNLDIGEEKCGEVVKGALYCGKCDHTYRITDHIPNLLPPDFPG